jgi:hypothetical protein
MSARFLGRLRGLVRRPKAQFSDLGENLSLAPEQIMIKETAKSFAKTEILPHTLEWDANSFFPREAIVKTAEIGFGGIYIPEAHGGSGLGRMEASLIFEGLSYGCASFSAFISIHNMVNWMISNYGNDDQRKEFCSRLNTMELLGSYCLTEPNSGSDAAAMKTKAVKKGGDYVLNGSKMFISGGGASDLLIVMCLTGEKEISAFIVDANAPGIIYGKNEKKMGWKNQPTSLVTFENCVVPARNLLGKAGDGFKYAMNGLNGGRVNIASCSLGGAEFAIDRAIVYAKERKQFGKRLIDFQNTQFKLATMEARLLASRLIVRQAAKALDQDDHGKIPLCSMAKLIATEDCFQIVDQALQLFGGYGYLHEYGIEKVLRDLRVHRILEGTNEIMQIIIAKHLAADN